MSTNILYEVIVEEYAEKHYIKSFAKTYRQARDITLKVIKESLARIDTFLLTGKAEKIHSVDHIHLVKCEFAVAGSRQSPHGSGNRYIVLLDDDQKKCTILLLYAKTDVKWKNETTRREQEIKNNYPEIKKIFTAL